VATAATASTERKVGMNATVVADPWLGDPLSTPEDTS
jgi:hypothetical protein